MQDNVSLVRAQHRSDYVGSFESILGKPLVSQPSKLKRHLLLLQSIAKENTRHTFDSSR